MKSINYRVFIFIIILAVSFFFIYSNYFQKEKNNQNISLEAEEEISTNSNIIKDIKYSSKDLKGNEYIILADEGEIDLDNSDIIFLKNVKAFLNLIEKNETITVVSDFGKYNTINYDTIFSQNVRIQYQDNSITGDYLDFSMKKNLLIISKNVVYTNPTNILKADVVELDTITKDTKIFMHNSKDKVNIESRN
ncbi:LPS export ABC transporter periplasmic protein LptC [Candidatus Pelagibacter sp. HIMB1623]|uniref:LPS export ABC transporter periplasmic protein LptC n=1 Tax=Candidatus Pelagibacter sp. HIMB1623 TaxID=3413358 RepID=UPI003F84C03F